MRRRVLLAVCLLGAIASGQTGRESVPVVERIRLAPGGFDPPEMQLPAGRTVLAITNHTNLKDLTVMIQAEGRDNSVRQFAAKDRAGSIYFREMMDLTPGTYILTVPIQKTLPDQKNEREWTCRIVVK